MRIIGEVIHGDGVGKVLGFPTANLSFQGELGNSVFAVCVYVRGLRYLGAGIHMPHKSVFEVHIIGFDQEIYGEKLIVDIIDIVRDNRKFSSQKSLVDQISQDLEHISSNYSLPQKNIAILHPTLITQWGANGTMLRTAELLSKSYQVDFYTLQSSSEVYPDLQDKVNILTINSWLGKWFSIFKMAWKLRKYDTVLIGNSPLHIVAFFLKRVFRSSCRIIWWHHHTPWLLNPKGTYKRMKSFVELKFIHPHIDQYMANSLQIAQNLKKRYQVSSQIQNPLIDDRFYNTPIASSIRRKAIFLYSRLVPGKGVRKFLSMASSQINQDIYIAWEGSLEAELKEQYGEFDHIHFVGTLSTPEIISYLDQCSCFVFWSTIDAYGMTLQEAISRGIRIIALNSPASQELLVNYEYGHIVQDENEFLSILKEKEGFIHTNNTQFLSTFQKKNHLFKKSEILAFVSSK